MKQINVVFENALGGSANTIKTNPTHVLLVADARDCAGLHLGALSHIVFFHRVADAAVRAQVIGRAARPGRRSDLAVTELVIEGEINWVGA